MKNQLIIIFGFFLSATLFAQDNHKICINEFLASNVSIDADIVDFDDYSDWIELYNDEDVEFDLGGYFITDDLKNPKKWEIPSGSTIAAKGFLRFWADGYDVIPGRTFWRSWLGAEAERLYFTTDYHHLNFKLSRAGEYIGLHNPEGEVVDSISFGLQHRDVSMGRKPDGSPDWFFFGEPTPEASNTTEGVLNLEYSKILNISPESGFYSGPQTATLTSNSAEATLKLTLDGSKPLSSSESYDLPLDIAETSVLRVRQYEKDKLPGSIVNRSYFLDENTTLPIISIIAQPEALWDEFDGIYPKRMKGREIPVTFDFFNSNNEFEYSLNVGLRLTGQASLYYPQVSFTIYARDRYGTDEIAYQIFPQRELNSYKSLYLRNAGVPDNRSTFFRDALQHSLVLNKIDIDCQAYLPSVVFINGEYWGIYNIRDKTNEDYLASIHNINPDDIDLLEYEMGSTLSVMNGNADNYNKFYEYIESNDLSLEENYRHVESWMDVEEYINYQICEIYYDNVFWPNQNMRMWRERKEDGKWRWILFDLDYGFGMPNMNSTGYSNNTLEYATSSNEGWYKAPEWSTLIFRKLLANKEFETKFIQRFSSYMNSVFHTDTVLATITKLQNVLEPGMPRHIQRWEDGEWYYSDPIPDMSSWYTSVDVMKEFARNRPQAQRQHIIDYFGLSGTTILKVDIENPGMGSVLINDVEVAENSYEGIHFKDVAVSLEAIPSIGYKFKEWEGIANTLPNPININLKADTLFITAKFDTINISTIPAKISRDTTLVKSDSPYFARGDIIVDSNITLTIEEGVEILMPEKANILVYGNLIIAGTDIDPVLISPNDYADKWGALCFINSTDSSIITNLVISGASSGPDYSRDKAAVSGYNADFCLKNVAFLNVSAPIFSQYGNVYIGGCKLHSDEAGDLINIKYAESAVVEYCDFRGNDSYDTDAIDFDGISGGIIRSNRIYNFYGSNSDAIDLGEGSEDILVDSNIIYNINDKGISIGHGSRAIIKRNLIANCGQGLGIKDFDSYAYIENNTFYGNHYGIASFEKNLEAGGGNADVVNCIFANSRNLPVFTDGLSDCEVSYSLSSTYALEGMHNILDDPLFLNNLYLSTNSPAINSGNPILPDDPDGSIADMGALPYDNDMQLNLLINEIHYNPPKGEGSEFIEIVNESKSSVDLMGFRLSGDIDFTFPEDSIDPGEFILVAKNKSSYDGNGYSVYQWDSGNLSNGPGSVILIDDEGRIIDYLDYDRRYWWNKEADGMGPSLELHNTSLENMISSSWRSSYSDGGTPGKSNNSVEITGIYINEFMASNTGIYFDENEEFDDWIEFYNSNDEPVNLGGLYLTDDLENPVKFLIPWHSPGLTTIPPRGYLLFWADGETDQGILHTNFKLSAGGEQIGLVQHSDGKNIYIDSLTYLTQAIDRSYGRYKDGTGNWMGFATPTPLVSNIITGIKYNDHLHGIFTLHQNYPNPFRTRTIIPYTLTETTHIELSVYDLVGRKIASLVKETQQAGDYEIKWNPERMRPGIYFCELKTGRGRQVMKMILND